MNDSAYRLGADIHPRMFFVDSGKSAAKLGMTIPSSSLHIMCKW